MELITFEGIQQGDSIRVEWAVKDVRRTTTGIVDRKLGSEWYTAQGCLLTPRRNDPTIYLLHRLGPVLPTEEGTVIIAEMPSETLPLILRDGKWWYLNGESFYHSNAVRNHTWKLAKVVEA